MKSFFKEAVSNLKVTGSFKPSSKFLINDCLKHLKFQENQIILEFGTGNGCFTKEILNRIPTSTKLISFEVNKNFYDHCENKFSDFSNFQIEKFSALEFYNVLEREKITKVDYIISSLPLAFFDASNLVKLFNVISLYLSNQGYFIQYQYTLFNYKMLKNNFNEVKINFTLRNIPPAFIYKCKVQ